MSHRWGLPILSISVLSLAHHTEYGTDLHIVVKYGMKVGAALQLFMVFRLHATSLTSHMGSLQTGFLVQHTHLIQQWELS